MGSSNIPFTAFSGGEIGKEVMSRVTMDGYGACAERLENFLPLTDGQIMLRPGLKSLVEVPGDLESVLMPFIYTQSYGLLLQDSVMYVISGTGLETTSAAGSTILLPVNGGSMNGWTALPTNPNAISWSGTAVELVSDGTNVQGFYNAVATTTPSTQHTLNITIGNGPVKFSVGTFQGADDIFPQTSLLTGKHALSFTPGVGVYYVQISSILKRKVLFSAIAVAGAGLLSVPTPWPAALLRELQREQSANVLYVTSGAGPKQRIERHGVSSWSVVNSNEEDGPFNIMNTDTSIQMTPSVQSGNGTLSCSQQFFESGHVGALFQLTHTGQNQQKACNGSGIFSDPIRITGIGTPRTFSYTISGTWSGTVQLQQSVGNTAQWTDISGHANTVNATRTYADGLDNQTVYYRLGFKTGAYTSGTANVSLTFSGGSQAGVCRVTAYTDPWNVSMEVLASFAVATATYSWSEGSWSDVQGWPTAVALFDGRLWGGLYDQFMGSVSNSYESHADVGTLASDAINRYIGVSNASDIKFILALERLVIGTARREVTVRSTSLDEAIVNTNITVKPGTTVGASKVQPLAIDTRGIFVDRSSIKLYELAWNFQVYNYAANNMMRLHKDIGRPGILQIDSARNPDLRLFAVRADGQLLVKLYDQQENVHGWMRVLTPALSGLVESLCVLPALNEDKIYLLVNRTVGGVTKRYVELFDPLYLADASAAARLDAYVEYNSVPVTALSGLPAYMEGQTVQIWADGAVHPDRTVSGGAITLNGTYSHVFVGFSYDAYYQSTKLAVGSQGGTALGMKGKDLHIILIFQNSTPVIQYGHDFTRMDITDDRALVSYYDSGPGLKTGTTDAFIVPGARSRDPRVCLKATGPAPVTLQAYVVGHDLNERT